MIELDMCCLVCLEELDECSCPIQEGDEEE